MATTLIGDIGGTHARFARVGASLVPQDVLTLEVAAFDTLLDAIHFYLQQTGGHRPTQASLALATSILGDAVRLTNARWSFSVQAVRQALGLERLVVLNDFTALALALPLLAPADLRSVGGGAPVAGAAKGLIGPGTGLGVSGLVPCGRDWVPLEGEGGHASLSPADDREAALLAYVRRDYPHVSCERLVSGTGLPLLARAVAAVDALPVQTDVSTAAAIFDGALADEDRLCTATLQTFCAMLGTAAGNLALTLGARGGVYIGGGLVPRLGTFFDDSPFRARFEGKGRFCAYLEAVPTWIIVATNPALVGAARALARS